MIKRKIYSFIKNQMDRILAPKSEKMLYRALIAILVFTLAYVFTEWRFCKWMPNVFFGDDLMLLLDFKKGDFTQSFWDPFVKGSYSKFRPVFMTFSTLLMSLFGERIEFYLTINTILNAVNACLVFVTAMKLSKGNKIVAAIISIDVAASHFALYQVTQVWGPLEGLGFAFFLITIFCSITSYDLKRANAMSWAFGSVVFSIIAFHTHERYIGLALWVGLVISVLPKNSCISSAQKCVLAGTSMAATASNILYKQYILNTPFLMGTGGQKIGINFSQITNHIYEATLSIIGFNEGPEYLVGSKALSSESWPAALLGAIFLSGYLLVVVSCFYNILTKRNDTLLNKWASISWPVLLGLLAVLLLIPPVMTIRVEQRWLLQPFSILLLILAWATKNSSRNIAATVLSCLAVLSLFVADTIICKHFDRIYMVQSGRFASLVKKELLDSKKITNGEIILIARKEDSNWTLCKNRFFNFYNKTKATFNCVDSLNQNHEFLVGKNTRIFFSGDNCFEEASPEQLLYLSTYASKKKVYFDFLDRFTDGNINNSVNVSTPNGKGVFKMPVTNIFECGEALTILPGFEYQFSNILIPYKSSLIFSLGMFYPSKYPISISIIVKDMNSDQKVRFSEVIPARRVNTKIEFQPHVISLCELFGKKVSVTFSATTLPGHDQSAHWALFFSPRLVDSK